MIRAFSYGGGVQSTAALVLAAQGIIDYPLFLFSNVGDDSEHPGTLSLRLNGQCIARRHASTRIAGRGSMRRGLRLVAQRRDFDGLAPL